MILTGSVSKSAEFSTASEGSLVAEKDKNRTYYLTKKIQNNDIPKFYNVTTKKRLQLKESKTFNTFHTSYKDVSPN